MADLLRPEAPVCVREGACTLAAGHLPPCAPAPVVLPPLERRAFSAADGQALTFAASLLDQAADVLLASGRWGKAHALRAAAELARELRAEGAPVEPNDSPEKDTASSPARPDAAGTNPCFPRS